MTEDELTAEIERDPFGTAIKARYFDRNAPSADAFVTWVRRLVD